MGSESTNARVLLTKGDITAFAGDAIVNAANTRLILGSGVSGAIRVAGGPSIQTECDTKSPIPLGEAAVTGAGLITARYIIHAAGMHRGGGVSAESLADATRNSLLRAAELGLATVAFPAIGTGAGGMMMAECARVMVGVVREYFALNPGTSIVCVTFVLFDDEALERFTRALEEGSG